MLCVQFTPKACKITPISNNAEAQNYASLRWPNANLEIGGLLEKLSNPTAIALLVLGQDEEPVGWASLSTSEPGMAVIGYRPKQNTFGIYDKSAVEGIEAFAKSIGYLALELDLQAGDTGAEHDPFRGGDILDQLGWTRTHGTHYEKCPLA